LSRGPFAISTAGPDDGAGTGDAELAVVDSGPGLDAVGAGGADGGLVPAAVELGGGAVDVGEPGGVEVVVSAVRTALLQPANPAAVSTRPAVIRERRERFIRTPSDYVPGTSRRCQKLLRWTSSYPGSAFDQHDHPGLPRLQQVS
jgi:hypothetical protein